MPNPKLPLLNQLLTHLTEFPDDVELNFMESREKDDLYGLYVSSENVEIIKKIAAVLGCPARDIPDDGVLHNADNWNGEIRFRDLADELTEAGWGEFFDEDHELGNLRASAAL